MSDRPKVKVHKPLREPPWRVDCDACGTDSWPFALQPWAFAKNWPSAVLLARWHLDLHAEQVCPTCGHVPPLERLKPLDSPGLFKVGERLYQARRGRITEVAPA